MVFSRHLAAVPNFGVSVVARRHQFVTGSLPLTSSNLVCRVLFLLHQTLLTEAQTADDDSKPVCQGTPSAAAAAAASAAAAVACNESVSNASRITLNTSSNNLGMDVNATANNKNNAISSTAMAAARFNSSNSGQDDTSPFSNAYMSVWIIVLMSITCLFTIIFILCGLFKRADAYQFPLTPHGDFDIGNAEALGLSGEEGMFGVSSCGAGWS